MKSSISLAAAALSAAAITCGSLAGAHAADQRQAIDSRYDWTGFYIGAHSGGAWATNQFFDSTASFSAANFDLKSSGIVAGGQLGANWQFGRFVIGAEADAAWASLRGEHLFNPTISSTQITARIDALATGTVRLGFAMGPWLAYAKGGAAFADVQFTNNSVAPTLVTVSQHRTGWTTGAGIEVAVWRNVSAKAEYNYLDFGQATVNFLGSGPIRPLDVNQSIHMMKAGFNVRFGGRQDAARD